MPQRLARVSIENKLASVLQGVGEGLDEVMTEQMGERIAFALIVAPFEKSKCRVLYISNFDPIQCIEMLEETANMIKAGEAPTVVQ